MLDQLRLVKPGLGRSAPALRIASDYLALTKPPIVLLLLVTAVGGIFLAADGNPSLSVLLLVCAGGALGAGGDPNGQAACGRPRPHCPSTRSIHARSHHGTGKGPAIARPSDTLRGHADLESWGPPVAR